MNYLLVVQVFVRISYQAAPGQLSVEINSPVAGSFPRSHRSPLELTANSRKVPMLLPFKILHGRHYRGLGDINQGGINAPDRFLVGRMQSLSGLDGRLSTPDPQLAELGHKIGKPAFSEQFHYTLVKGIGDAGPREKRHCRLVVTD